MNIAILGYGTVGKNLEKLINFYNNSGKGNIEISHILMRECDELTKENMTSSLEEIVNDDKVDIVVECIGGDEPAFTYAKTAIVNGKHFITSNKKMAAKHLLELIELANTHKVKFLFSAACGGGIPWITEISRMKEIGDTIRGFKGIMNGTTNFILDKMDKENMPFDLALKEAQEYGYAEADPSDDIDGVDTANKCVLTSAIALNTYFKPEDVITRGIRYIRKEDIEYAKKNNYKCVLLGKGSIECDMPYAYVVPTFVSQDSVFSSVNENYNCFMADCFFTGPLHFIGMGAGGEPTASTVLRDIFSIIHPYEINIENKMKPNYSLVQSMFYVHSKNPISFKNSMISTRIDDYTVITREIGIDEIVKILEKDDFIAEIDPESIEEI